MGKYKSTASIDNKELYKDYIQVLDEIIKKEEIYNIGIIGPYGSGKSSLVKSYLSCTNKKYCKVSLAYFNEDSSNKRKLKNISLYKEGKTIFSEKKKCDSKSIETIERSILQQILFSKKSSELPYSKLNRIGTNKLWISIFKALLITSTIFFLCMAYWYYNVYCNICNKGFYKSMVIFFILLTIVFIFFFRKKGRFKNIKLMNFEAEFENKDNEFILNKFLDEILYFFSASKTEILVIEDLDRFNKLEVFTKLRELNTIINESNIVKQKVVFIYCIKDTLFKSDLERAKFFEFIITMIPELNPKSIKSILTTYNDELEENRKLNNDFLGKISYFITDYRLLINVFNDYNLFCDILKLDTKFKESLKKENAFSMMLYKNLYPKEYAELQFGKGKLGDIFTRERKIKQITLIDSEINRIKNEIEKIKSSYADDMKDIIEILKVALIVNNKTTYSNLSNYINIDEIEDLDFEKHNKFIYKKYSDVYYYGNLEELQSKIKFLNFKSNNILNKVKKDLLISEKEKKIKDFQTRKQNVETMTIKNYFNEFGIEEVEFENKLIEFLILNGYIEENYLDYISKSSLNFLSINDNKYISNVLLNKTSDVDFKLDNVINVINEINLEYFKTRFILNYDIINELILNINFKNKKKEFYEFIKLNKESYIEDFIIGYLNKFNVYNEFIDFVIENRIDIVSKVLLIENSVNNDMYNNLIIKILKSKVLTNIYKSGSKIVEILNKKTDLYFNINMIFNEIKESLIILNCKLNDLSNFSVENAKYLISNSLYEINIDTIKQVFYLLEVNYGLSTIMNTNAFEYIKNNISIFTDYLSGISNNLAESAESIKFISSNKDKINYENYLSKIDNKFDYINNLDTDLVNFLFKNNKIKNDWIIYNNYYENYEIDKNILIDAINNNLIELKEKKIDNTSLLELVITNKDINISNFISSFSEKITYKNELIYNENSLIYLYFNDLLYFNDYYNIERYPKLIKYIVNNDTNNKIVDNIGYNENILNDYLMENDMFNFIIKYIEKFKKEIINNWKWEFNLFVNKLYKLSDEFKILMIKYLDLDSEQIRSLVTYIRNTKFIKENLQEIIRNYNINEFNEDTKINLIDNDIILFKTLRAKNVLSFKISTNSKYIYEVRIL